MDSTDTQISLGFIFKEVCMGWAEGIVIGIVILFVILIAVLLLYIFECIGKPLTYEKQVDNKDVSYLTNEIASEEVGSDAESLFEEVLCTGLDYIIDVTLLNEPEQFFCNLKSIQDRFNVNVCMVKSMQSAIEQLHNKPEFKNIQILPKVLSEVEALYSRSREYLSDMMFNNDMLIKPLLKFEHSFYTKMTQCIKKVRDVISSTGGDIHVCNACLSVFDIVNERCHDNDKLLVNIMQSLQNCASGINR